MTLHSAKLCASADCSVDVSLLCLCVYSYTVKLLRNGTYWLVNSGETETMQVNNAAVMTAVIESNETNVSSDR